MMEDTFLSEKEELERKKKDLEKQQEEIMAFKNLMDQDKKELEQKRSDLSKQVKEFELHKERVQDQIDQTEIVNVDLQKQRHELQNMKDILQKEKDDLNQMKVELKQQEKDLETSKDDLQKQRDDMKNMYYNLQKEKDHLAQKKDEVDQQKKMVDDLIERYNKEKDQLELSKSEIAEEKSKHKKMMEDTFLSEKEELERKKKDLEKQQEEIMAFKILIDQDKKELEQKRSDLSKQVKEFELHKERVQDQINQNEIVNVDLQKQRHELQNMKDILQKDKDELNQMKVELKQQENDLDTSKDDLQKLREDERNSVKQLYEELEKQRKDFEKEVLNFRKEELEFIQSGIQKQSFAVQKRIKSEDEVNEKISPEEEMKRKKEESEEVKSILPEKYWSKIPGVIEAIEIMTSSEDRDKRKKLKKDSVDTTQASTQSYGVKCEDEDQTDDQNKGTTAMKIPEYWIHSTMAERVKVDVTTQTTNEEQKRENVEHLRQLQEAYESEWDGCAHNQSEMKNQKEETEKIMIIRQQEINKMQQMSTDVKQLIEEFEKGRGDECLQRLKSLTLDLVLHVQESYLGWHDGLSKIEEQPMGQTPKMENVRIKMTYREEIEELKRRIHGMQDILEKQWKEIQSEEVEKLRTHRQMELRDGIEMASFKERDINRESLIERDREIKLLRELLVKEIETLKDNGTYMDNEDIWRLSTELSQMRTVDKAVQTHREGKQTGTQQKEIDQSQPRSSEELLLEGSSFKSVGHFQTACKGTQTTETPGTVPWRFRLRGWLRRHCCYCCRRELEDELEFEQI
ncbi:uncharacterized protein PF11_0207-like [Denticeps clupeoides]|uniref:uncharacterized protein PF11_0207-like n=1 Tax=Denticeps clupeoides TaxID=299321 RepID=UPI0010A4AD65|nr:uncharacterized protein PF11_0207-like [Denticeps clupeoides]